MNIIKNSESKIFPSLLETNFFLSFFFIGMQYFVDPDEISRNFIDCPSATPRTRMKINKISWNIDPGVEIKNASRKLIGTNQVYIIERFSN